MDDGNTDSSRGSTREGDVRFLDAQQQQQQFMPVTNGYRLPPQGADPPVNPALIMPQVFSQTSGPRQHFPTALQLAADLASKFGIGGISGAAPSGIHPAAASYRNGGLQYASSAPHATAASLRINPPFETTVVPMAAAKRYLDPPSPILHQDPSSMSSSSNRPLDKNVFHSISGLPPDFQRHGAPKLFPYDDITFPRLDRAQPAQIASGTLPPPSGQAELEAMWTMGLLDHERATQNDGDIKSFGEYGKRFHIQLPSNSLTAESEAKNAAVDEQHRKKEGDNGVSTRGPMSSGPTFLSGVEIARLREMQQQIGALERAKKAELEKMRSSGAALPQALRLQESAYLKENAKLRKVLSLRTEAGQRKVQRILKPKAKALRSSTMDSLIFLERLETQAAIVIQRIYRKHLRTTFWKKFMRDTRSANRIQRVWRGYWARKQAREYFKKRSALAVKLQAAQRGKMAREEQEKERIFEMEAAQDIQRTFRGWYFRRKAHKRAMKRAVTKIQKVWRGVKGRSIADKRYLDKCANVIQRNVRRFLTKKTFDARFALESHAALGMQTLFRGWRVRQARNTWLHDKDTEARKAWMAIMKANESWANNVIEKLVKQREKIDLDGQIRTYEKEWLDAQNRVVDREFDYVTLMNEYMRLSPRSIEQGWNHELVKNTTEHREWVTNLKVSAIFKVAKPLRALIEKRKVVQERILDLISDRKRLSDAWSSQRAQIWERASEMKAGLEKFSLARGTAEEKRKWAVQYFTRTGKVDLSRRIGKPLVLEDFPHAENKSLTIAHASLLEFTKIHDQFDPEAAEKEQRSYRLALEHQMQEHLRNEQMRLEDLAAQLKPGARPRGFATGDFKVSYPPLLQDGETAILLEDGTVAVGPEKALLEAQRGAPVDGPLERVGPPEDEMFTVAGGRSGGVVPGIAPVGPLMRVDLTMPRQDRGGVPGQGGGGGGGLLPVAMSPTSPNGKNKFFKFDESGDERLKESLNAIDKKRSVPDLSSSTSTEAQDTAENDEKNKSKERMHTVGTHFGEEHGGVLSHMNTKLEDEKLRARTGIRYKPLHERVWEINKSRFGGTGYSEYSRSGQADNVKADRERVEKQHNLHMIDSAQAALDIADSDSITSSEMFTYRTDQSGAQPLAILDATARSAIDANGALVPIDQQPLLTQQPSSVDIQNRLPQYKVDKINRLVEVSSKDMPSEIKTHLAEASRRMKEKQERDALPPGLAGARAGEAAMILAKAKSSHTIGTSGVTSTDWDKSEEARIEQARMDRQSSNVNHLVGKIIAVNAQTELMQYGALTKPIMDGMATLQAHLLGADGTFEVVNQAASLRAKKEADRHQRLEARKTALSTGEAVLPNSTSGGGGGGGGGGGSFAPQSKSMTTLMSSQQPVQKKKGESLLTETYYPPPANNTFDKTTLSLAETRPSSKQHKLATLTGTAAAASAATTTVTAEMTSNKQLSVAQMRKLGMRDGYDWEDTLDDKEKERLSALDKSIEVLKKTQARGRAYGAVLDIDKTLKSVNVTSTINLRGAATSGGDLWGEDDDEEGGGRGIGDVHGDRNRRGIALDTSKQTKGKNSSSVGIDSDSTLWDMDTRLAYERSILMNEMNRPLPSSFPRPQPEPQRLGAQFASYDKEMFKKLPKQQGGGGRGGGGGGGSIEINKNSVSTSKKTSTKR
jgi:hypothetical protein